MNIKPYFRGNLSPIFLKCSILPVVVIKELKNSHMLIKRISTLANFKSKSEFLNKGALIIDLDGTVLSEESGKVYISGSAENGMKGIYNLKRPVILNTLRFPLSVIRTIAPELLSITGGNIPAVLLNGSQLGYFENNGEEVVFKEIVSFPFKKEELAHIVAGVDELIDKGGVRDIDLFYYPRDWRKGEIIWVPGPHRVESIKARYRSASRVETSSTKDLLKKMIDNEVCMIFLLVDRPKDSLMAYQHQDPMRFYTTEGVDKSFGTRKISEIMSFSPKDSIGAGDTIMDNFLERIGLAVVVGNADLPFRGMCDTVKVSSPNELGELLTTFTGFFGNQQTI